MKIFATIIALSIEALSHGQFQNGGVVPGQGILLSRVPTMSQAPTPSVDNVLLMNLENDQLYRWDLSTLTWKNYDSINIQNSKNVSNGIAGLDVSGKIMASVLSNSIVSTALGYIPLKPSDTVGKWKAASYTPSNAEVIGAIGYTPLASAPVSSVNGATGVVTIYSPGTTDTSNWNSLYRSRLKLYGPAGLISSVAPKIWLDTNITPSTGNGYSIDISSAGFSNILGTFVIAKRNGSSPNTSPNVSVKSFTNTAVVVNIVEDNTATQNVLISLIGGLTSVVNGYPSVFANVTGLKLHAIVVGY